MRPEDMRIYKPVRELGLEVDRIVAMLPPHCSKIANHLERSLESIGFNLNEALTAYKPKVKASALDITRRETSEARKALQRAVDKKGVPATATVRADKIANAIIGMSTVMIKQQEVREKNGE
jgi:four helix bundle protein